ncbi:FAD-binding oxidoreductase [bacterium]|nr:FAD-binding oxidoreductase [bacterium]
MSDIITKLTPLLDRDAILTGDDVTSRSANNWGRPSSVEAKAIIRPRTTEEVSAVLRICNQAEQPVITHGGLTGVVGGTFSSADDIILSLERMNQVEELDAVGRTMTVQAGAILQNLQEAAEKVGLMLPLDLGARGSCMIGGNVATNAGGNRVIRFGMTRDLLLGLEVVLADGTVLTSLNKMIKNNAGYDLKHLFIGSEGTLGVITRMVLRLRPLPGSQNNAFIALDSFDNVLAFLNFIDGALGGTLSAFEVMWKNFYELVTRDPAPSPAPLTYDHPYYVLLESLGANQQEDSTRFEQALNHASEQGLLAEAVLAQSKAERDAMWGMRDDVQQIWRYDPVFLFDVSLPVKEMPGYVEKVQLGLDKVWPDNLCFTFGHLGDGNIHFFVSAGKDDETTRSRVEEIVYKPLMKVNGSVSAEHGVGLDKRRYLPWCRSDAEMSVMKRLRQALDPKGILNPGKIFE